MFCWNLYSAWGYDVEVDGIYYYLNTADKTATVTNSGSNVKYSVHHRGLSLSKMRNNRYMLYRR